MGWLRNSDLSLEISNTSVCINDKQTVLRNDYYDDVESPLY